jgi:hypothetical protein
MAGFSMTRAITVDAPPERIHALLDDFREWQRWSPWEGLDPDLRRTFTGAEQGVGSHYAWAGNKKAGEGTMEMTSVTPSEVVVDLRFLKPFKAQNVTRFDLVPLGSGTRVTWTMTGQRNPVMSLMGKLFFDKAIGADFEKGLASLKAEAERG